jgi:hypothetical protein
MMEFKINLVREDWLIFQKYISAKLGLRAKTWWNGIWFSLIIWSFLGYSFTHVIIGLESLGSSYLLAFGTAMLVVAAVHYTNQFHLKNFLWPAEQGCFCGEHHFVFDGQGWRSESKAHSNQLTSRN